MPTINLRTDDEVDRALIELGAGPGDRNRSKVVRAAILQAAELHRRESLRREAEALAADPDDLAEVRATQAALEPLRAW
jgi:hypothetical protein